MILDVPMDDVNYGVEEPTVGECNFYIDQYNGCVETWVRRHVTSPYIAEIVAMLSLGASAFFFCNGDPLLWIWMNTEHIEQSELAQVLTDHSRDFMTVYDVKVFHTRFHARMATRCLKQVEEVIDKAGRPAAMESLQRLQPDVGPAGLPSDGEAFVVAEDSDTEE